MKSLSLRCFALAGLVASATPAQATLTPFTDLLPSGAAVLTFTIGAPAAAPHGFGFLLMATERGAAPLPTPWGPFWLLPPPLVLGATVVAPTGSLTFPLPPTTPPFAAAFQAVTVDPTFTVVSASNYALAGFTPPGPIATGEGAAGDYDDRTQSYRVNVIGAPGQWVEIFIVEPRNNHVILINRAQIQANGTVTVQGRIQPGGLGAGNHLEVHVGGVKKLEFK